MNTFFSQLKKETREIRLSVSEREDMRRVLEGAMRLPALHAQAWQAGSRHAKSSVRATPSLLFFFTSRLVSSLAFVLILAVIGGSTVYAAERAVPGDVLYPLKVSVNEQVVAALAVSPEDKAEVQARFAERRMEEAETLSARSAMTVEVKVALEERFDEHIRAVEEAVALVEEKDPIAAADISARFESKVAAHSAVIEQLSRDDGDEESRTESGKFARSMREHGERIAMALPRAAMKAETSDSFEISARTLAQDAASQAAESLAIGLSLDDAGVIERLAENASTTLEEIEVNLSALGERLDASTSARTKAQISKIRARVEKFRSGRNQTPFTKEDVQRAFKDAVRVNTFLEAQGKFHDRTLLPALDIEDGDEEDNGALPELDGTSQLQE